MCLFQCRDGYMLKGNNTTQCYFGNWTGMTPWCKEGKRRSPFSFSSVTIYLFDFSLLPLPWVYWARQDPADRQHGSVRVSALRQEDSEQQTDYVPVWPGLLHDRARAIGSHLHSRGVVTSPAAQALSDVSDTLSVTVTILQMCRGLSSECQTAEVSFRRRQGHQGDTQEKERRRLERVRGNFLTRGGRDRSVLLCAKMLQNMKVENICDFSIRRWSFCLKPSVSKIFFQNIFRKKYLILDKRRKCHQNDNIFLSR